MVSTKKCIVKGCTSAQDQKNFKKILQSGRPAFCPLHSCLSTVCNCDQWTKLFSFYSFPKKPNIRRIWYLMLRLSEDYVPTSGHMVCSRHFNYGASRMKIPTLQIGRTEEEIQGILKFHVNAVIEEQEIISLLVTKPERMIKPEPEPFIDLPPEIDRYDDQMGNCPKNEPESEESMEPNPQPHRIRNGLRLKLGNPLKLGNSLKFGYLSKVGNPLKLESPSNASCSSSGVSCITTADLVLPAWTKVVKEEPVEDNETNGSVTSDLLSVKPEPVDVDEN